MLYNALLVTSWTRHGDLNIVVLLLLLFKKIFFTLGRYNAKGVQKLNEK